MSNNQIIVYSSFLESLISINLHLSTQALASGLKPLTEKYRQNQPEYQDSYQILFQKKLKSSEVTNLQPSINKLYQSGYTSNILINDPYFVQLLLIYSLSLLILSLVLLSKRLSEYEF